jgi:tetratricopeptide (TPR) repeat protein
MAVITHVVELARAREREALETWRVYGIETKIIGRSTDLAALDELLGDVTRGSQNAVVSVTAPTGLGKSRLVDEFRRQVEGAFSETVFLQAACRDEIGSPYSIFGRLLRNRFYIAEAASQTTIRQSLEEAVRALVAAQDVERVAHRVGYLIGVSFPDSPHVPDVRDTEGAHQLDEGCFEAFKELLEADGRRNPLVIILEDLQYATPQSLALIEYLARATTDCSILFVLSWNPREFDSTVRLPGLVVDQTIALHPLSDDEVHRFVRDTLRKARHVPARLVEKIVESAHGNPLAVEEMLRILISEGIIDTRQQEWSIDEKRLAQVKLPTTVEETVAARLEALTTQEREVLGMAACVGNVFWPSLIVSLYHLQVDVGESFSYWLDSTNSERVDEILESLERKDMIRRHDGESWLRGHDELYFKHRLEREALYDSLSSQSKQRYHRLIAQWMAHQVDDEQAASAAETIARHYDAARCLDHAARRFIEAADYARRHYANQKAIELYGRGLAYLSDADLELKMRAYHDLGKVHELLGAYDQALESFLQMLRLSWILGDQANAGAAYNRLGCAYRSLGEYDKALEHLENGLGFFRSLADVHGIANSLDDIGKIYWIRGLYDRAMQYYAAALQLRREIADERAIAMSLNHLGSLKLQRGELKDAMVYFKEALEIRRAVDDRHGVADSYNSLGVLCMERGDVDQAITLFEEALVLARQLAFRSLECVILNNLGESLLTRDEVDRAERILNEAMAVTEDSGEKRVLFDILRNLGKVAQKQADRKVAIERIEEALTLANELESQVLLAMGIQSLADVHAAYVFDPDLRDLSSLQAEALYKEAIAIFEEVGHEAQLARCMSNYGHFLLEVGQIVQGKKTLEMAGEIFKRLEIRKLWDATERIIEEV